MTSSQEQGSESGAAETVGQAIEILGEATPEQVAALVAVLSAASGGSTTEGASRHTSPWSAPARLVRRAPAPGPGAWQHSLRP